jgi:hypothetical protein
LQTVDEMGVPPILSQSAISWSNTAPPEVGASSRLDSGAAITLAAKREEKMMVDFIVYCRRVKIDGVNMR